MTFMKVIKAEYLAKVVEVGVAFAIVMIMSGIILSGWGIQGNAKLMMSNTLQAFLPFFPILMVVIIVSGIGYAFLGSIGSEETRCRAIAETVYPEEEDYDISTRFKCDYCGTVHEGFHERCDYCGGGSLRKVIGD